MRECLILAGGLGTRLAHLVPDLPKSLAPIDGKPFLNYLIHYLLEQKVEHFIFSLGHRHAQITEFLQKNFSQLNFSIVIEPTPLGTGGAIVNSLDHINSEDFFLINADTFYTISFDQLESFHMKNNADITFAIKPMINPFRYGTIECDIFGKVKHFQEKKMMDFGLINGGINIINRKYFKEKKSGKVFSFEKEILEANVNKDRFYSLVQDSYFIDIGIPEDYNRGIIEIPVYKSEKIKKTLFLDRDGVINNLIPNDYVKTPEEFIFTNGFLDNIEKISNEFDYIFVVTNQQCIGKNIVSLEALTKIHYKMTSTIRQYKGKITKIYYCPHLINDFCKCRKPEAGLLDQIRAEFPEVRFTHTIFIGDSETDMQAAHSRNIKSIFFNHSNQTSSSIQKDAEINNWDSALTTIYNLSINKA